MLLTFSAVLFTLCAMVDEDSFDLLSAQPGDARRGTEWLYSTTVMRNLDEELRCRGWARKSDGDFFSTELVRLEGWSEGSECSRAGAEALIRIAWRLLGWDPPTWDDPLNELRDAAQEKS